MIQRMKWSQRETRWRGRFQPNNNIETGWLRWKRHRSNMHQPVLAFLGCCECTYKMKGIYVFMPCKRWKSHFLQDVVVFHLIILSGPIHNWWQILYLRFVLRLACFKHTPNPWPYLLVRKLGDDASKCCWPWLRHFLGFYIWIVNDLTKCKNATTK